MAETETQSRRGKVVKDIPNFLAKIPPKLLTEFEQAATKQGVTAEDALGAVMEQVIDGRLFFTKKINYDEKDKDKRRATVGKALMRENVRLRTIENLAKRDKIEEET